MSSFAYSCGGDRYAVLSVPNRTYRTAHVQCSMPARGVGIMHGGLDSWKCGILFWSRLQGCSVCGQSLQYFQLSKATHTQ